MKDVFHSTGFKIMVAVVFAMLCLMLYTAGAGDSATGKLFGFITIPMQRISTIVANNAAVSAESAARSKEELEAENRSLRRQVDELNKKLVNYYSAQQENAQLRKFLELKNNNQDFKPVAAAVIGRDPNDLFGQFTIDQGSQAGISVNDPVVTEAGVVGWVSSLNSSYSKVTTILSPETKISAMDRVNRETGVVGCDIRAADRSLLHLNYLSAGTAVKAGELVVTSGIGGLYPRNLIIGTVKDVKNSSYDVSLYAEVKPAVDVKSVRDVLVITAFQGQGQALGTASSGASGTASSAGGTP
ncbi:MAG TPA: rod shape-determining protein MreC [Ruminococcaceae bacterium]|nr:rod shape-determining protein MreC [Oscillospiraceae bacterium]